VERIGTSAAADMVVAAAAEDRVIAVVAVDVVVAEGDAIQNIDGFRVVCSYHESHDSFTFPRQSQVPCPVDLRGIDCPTGGAAKSTSSPVCM
jgi:hypothetical protein